MQKDICLYFDGAKPCQFHKKSLIPCQDCQNFVAIRKRILVIKLGAMGDVVRTTAILHKLKTDKSTEITWITKKESAELLQNKFINRLFFIENPLISAILKVEKFDEVYSLDNDYYGAILGEIAKAKIKFGYGVKAKTGKLYGFTKAAHKWLAVATDDNLKKANKKNYQEILFKICNLTFEAKTDLIVLPTDSKNILLPSINKKLNPKKETWAINVGAGNRWPYKSIAMANLIDLIKIALKNKKNIILIGGPSEQIAMKAFVKKFGSKVINSGTNNSVKQLISILNLADVIITGDTLTMHLGIGLNKRVYTYIGPTSANELETYGVMTKLVAEKDCICCYKTTCEETPKCNESFSFEPMFEKEGIK